MNRVSVGCVLREHREGAEGRPVGRVIHIDRMADLVVVIRFPGKNHRGHHRNYIRSPQWLSLSPVEAQVEAGDLSAISFDVPPHWLLSDTELAEGASAGLSRHSRRRLSKWLAKRNRNYSYIEPFVSGRSIEEILTDTSFSSWPARRAKELGLSGASTIQRALNAYLLGLGVRNSLLPNYTQNGAPGRQKLSKTKTGRPREFAHEGTVQMTGLNCDPDVRRMFIMGWKRYKKPGVSVKSAFENTIEHWLGQSVQFDGPRAHVQVDAEVLSFSLEQFRYWGQRGIGALPAKRIELGETEERRSYLRRQSKAADRHISVNSIGFVDSTSTDQTLCSSVSRLQVVSSPWRTQVLGSPVNYIFGIHVGFEHVSSLTTLLAVLHAAEDKVEFCNRFGIKIQSRDWLSMRFSTLAMDNGEGKSQYVMKTLEDLEGGASFGKAYDAINKSPLESNHQVLHLGIDHKTPASTMGKVKRRGEPARALLARLNFFEYMPRLLETILHYNNEEKIELPTLEMRRDGVEPTRRGVVEWMTNKGYQSSVFTDLDTLRVRCLPTVDAVIHDDGIHLFDPTYEQRRLVKKLIYSSEWLRRSRLLDPLYRNQKYHKAHLDPNDLTKVWVNIDGLKCLDLIAADEQMRELTLLEWLLITRDDRHVEHLDRAVETQRGVNRRAGMARATANAEKERAEEMAAAGKKPSKSSLKRGIRDNTAAERAGHTGLPPSPQHTKRSKTDALSAPAASPIAQAREASPSLLADVIDSLED